MAKRVTYTYVSFYCAYMVLGYHKTQSIWHFQHITLAAEIGIFTVSNSLLMWTYKHNRTLRLACQSPHRKDLALSENDCIATSRVAGIDDPASTPLSLIGLIGSLPVELNPTRSTNKKVKIFGKYRDEIAAGHNSNSQSQYLTSVRVLAGAITDSSSAFRC